MHKELPMSASHSKIKAVLSNIYMVSASNHVEFEGNHLQHSRNMVILREGRDLTLINSVKLSDAGLAELEQLGEIKHVIRIGSFHGKDDSFYINRYQAKLWALQGMKDENGTPVDVSLDESTSLPIKSSSLFIFKNTNFPEACIHINSEGGILISCDSIKNWQLPDPYFSHATAKLYEQQGMFGQASISDIWLQAMGVTTDAFGELMSLEFKHLLSAHGQPLLDNAKVKLQSTLEKQSFT